MKLIKCYIENFGVMHQYSYEFQDGLNTINELNGWGKSTFAAFIRAMFYGMKVSRAKDLDQKERIKYKPWQGGAFGGHIIFEINNKQYKIERFFGDKEKDDTFVVYDQATGLISYEFTSNIGEEIFKLDKDAYSRSTYIPQNSIAIESNDSINAKLSNLIESDNDINSYDSAMKILEKSKKEYVKTGGRGKLDLITNKITSLHIDLEKCQSKGEAVEQWNQKLEDLINVKKNIKENLQNVKGQVEIASKYETQAAKLQQYDDICSTESKTKEEIEPLISFFGEKIPTDEDIKNGEELSSELLNLQAIQKTYEFTYDETAKLETLKNYFSTGIPLENDLIKCDDLFATYHENNIKIAAYDLTEEEKKKIVELDEFFQNGMPEESEIDHYIDVIPNINDLNNKIIAEKSKAEILRNVEVMKQQKKVDEKKKGGKIQFILAIFLLLVGIIFIPVPFVSIPCLAAAVVLFITTNKNKKNQSSEFKKEEEDRKQESSQDIQHAINNLSEQKVSIENELNRFLIQFPVKINTDNYFSSLSIIKTKANEYRNLYAKLDNQECQALKNKQTNILAQIDSYLKPYCSVSEQSTLQKESIWKELKINRTAYLNLCEKSSKYEETNSKYNKIKHKLLEFLQLYFNQVSDNLSQQVNILKDKRKEYIRLCGELENLNTKRKLFENENEVQEWKDIKAPEYNLKELQDKEKQLEDELERVMDEENDARGQIRSLSTDADKCPDLQSEIELLEEQLTVGKERLEILNKTIQCLETAKTRFSTHYMDNMNQGFKQYLNMLDDGKLGETNMDVQLNVNITANGAQKSLDYFSTGYRDLVGICTRLALVDALFENENPFILLDDPFVNLDERKLENALNMLQNISKKYQIIYFVCHESRALLCGTTADSLMAE